MSSPEHIRERRVDVYRRIAAGATVKEAAEAWGVSTQTIHVDLAAVRRGLGEDKESIAEIVNGLLNEAAERAREEEKSGPVLNQIARTWIRLGGLETKKVKIEGNVPLDPIVIVKEDE